MRKAAVCFVVLGLLAAACGSENVTNASLEPGTSEGVAGASLEPSSSERSPIDPAAPIDALAAGFNDAGFDVLRTQDLTTNTVLSPVSIGHALLMARAAADDATGANIDSAFALPEGISAHDAWNAIDQMISEANEAETDMNGDASPVVAIADRIWPASTVTPDQTWVDLLATHHGSDVSTIDVTQPEASRVEINEWVSQQTKGLIPELLPVDFINRNTTLVLTDAIYFKAQWLTIFGKYGTVTGDFTKLDGTAMPLTLMRDLENRGRRGLGDGWAAAELPYLGEEFSMLLIVPDEGNFEEVRARLGTDLLAEIDGVIVPGPYELLLPKWEDDSNIDLLPWLTEIGAAPGSYPKITLESVLAGAVHAADIAVDEIGTVAAAATALGFNESGPPEPEFTIAADRPFFYVIRHNASGMALFVGQVTDPTQ